MSLDKVISFLSAGNYISKNMYVLNNKEIITKVLLIFFFRKRMRIKFIGNK